MARVFGLGMGATSLLAVALAMSPVARAKVGVDSDVDGKEDHHFRVAGKGGPFLGVRLEEVDKEDVSRLKLPEERGALVKGVEEDSPAKKAGLQEGDVVVRFGGETVQSAAQLARLVHETPVGRVVAIEVVRGGAVQKLTATLGEGRGRFRLDLGDLDVPEPPSPPLPPVGPDVRLWDKWGRRALLDQWGLLGQGPRKLGLEYQEISDQLAKYFKLSEEKGVLVTRVDPEGPAAKAGLRAGDVILKLDGRTVRDQEDFQHAVGRMEAGKEVVVTVQREGRPLDLRLTAAGGEKRERDKGGDTTL
jgi:serine protease Do